MPTTPYDKYDFPTTTEPLDTDFGFDPNAIDTDYPIIVPGPYRATISKAEKKVKDDGTKQIRVVFQIDDECKTESGTLIPGGFHKLSKTYAMSEAARPFVARLLDAVYNCKKGSRPAINPSDWEGKQVLLDVKIDPERVDPRTGFEYARGNSINNTMALRQ